MWNWTKELDDYFTKSDSIVTNDVDRIEADVVAASSQSRWMCQN